MTNYDYINLGFNTEVAEALAGKEVPLEQVPILSTEEIMSHFLEWNGIVGYTRSIINALDNIRNVAAL